MLSLSVYLIHFFLLAPNAVSFRAVEFYKQQEEDEATVVGFCNESGNLSFQITGNFEDKIVAPTMLEVEESDIPKNEYQRHLFVKGMAREALQSWMVNLEKSNETPNKNGTMVTENFDAVTIAVLYSKSAPGGMLVILDTGSSHAVLPLNLENTGMKHAFKSLIFDSIIRYSGLVYYGRLGACPKMFKEGFYCTVASYVQGMTNSIVGHEEIYFNPRSKRTKVIVAEHMLNNINGSNSSDLGIIGLSFGAQKFKSNPFLEPYFRTQGPQNVLFSLSKHQAEKVKVKPSCNEVGSVQINVDFEKKDYVWSRFSFIDTNFVSNAIYGLSITTEGSPGVHKFSIQELNDTADYLSKEKLNSLFYNKAIFDSGTSTMILNERNYKRISAQLKNIYGDMLLRNERGDDKLLLWPTKETAKKYGYITPDKVYVNILMDEIKMTVPLDDITFLKLNYNGMTFHGTVLMVPWFYWDHGTIVIGHSVWKNFDMLWDANTMRLGIKNGKVSW